MLLTASPIAVAKPGCVLWWPGAGAVSGMTGLETGSGMTSSPMSGTGGKGSFSREVYDLQGAKFVAGLEDEAPVLGFTTAGI